VDQESQATQRRLPFEPSDEIVGQGDALESGAQHELTGMEDECLVRLRLDELGEIGLLLLDVDVRIARVREHPELGIDVQVDR
jgi:hypothetical protein